MDWGEAFNKFPVVFAVYNPTDGSKRVANLNWALHLDGRRFVGDCFSLGTTLAENWRRNPDAQVLAVVNTFLNPDWGFQVGDRVSNSLMRHKNLLGRAADNHGAIDAEKMMDIFEIRLFNDDGTFKGNGGPTKPTKQDADLTNHQIVTNRRTLDVWLKIHHPPIMRSDFSGG